MATDSPPAEATAVNFEHSTGLGSLLSGLGLSVAITTYQAGKLITVGTHNSKVDIRFHHFEQAMGLARTPEGLAVGTKRQIWFLDGSAEVAPRIPPAGTHDVALLARHAHFTGPIMGHEMAQGEGGLWFVNTLFSCVCTLRSGFSFAPRWRPPFVSALAAEDRCHLNGLALADGRPRYATALGETDTPAGWRPGKVTGGCLIDIPANRVVLRGLSMPHSPRVHNGRVYFLHSGHGQVCRADAATGKTEPVADLPGYTRGFDLFGRYAFVGLSRIRETNVFGGMPIAERRAELKCGLVIVELETGRPAATLVFHSGVEEVFEVKVLPGFRNPVVSGPLPDIDGSETVWMVPS